MIELADVTAHQVKLRKAIAAEGLSLEVRYDFSHWQALNEEAGRGALTPLVDPESTAIEPGQFFSVAGRANSGRLCHIQCARLVDLEEQSLHEHLVTNRDIYCSPDLGLAPWMSRVESKAAWRFKGRTAYQGEMWIAQDWRGAKLAPPLILFMMMETLRAWWPNLLFALTLPVTSNRAFANKVGYSDCEPQAFAWHLENGDLLRHEGMVWAERSHLLNHVDLGYPLAHEVDLHRLANPSEAGQRLASG